MLHKDVEEKIKQLNFKKNVPILIRHKKDLKRYHVRGVISDHNGHCTLIVDEIKGK